MTLTHMITHILGIFNQVEKSNPYGSELEKFIISKSPQSIYDVEQLTRQFDTQLSQGKL